jgi:hypothetical protein
MLCTSCTNELPDGSPSCPKCGRKFSPAPALAPAPAATNPTALTPHTVPKDEAARLAAFVDRRQRVFSGWVLQRSYIAVTLAVLAGAIVFSLFSAVVPHTVDAFKICLVVTVVIMIAVWTALENWLLRKVMIPTLPCPYCEKKLKLLTVNSPSKAVVRPAACPHCQRALPQ